MKRKYICKIYVQSWWLLIISINNFPFFTIPIFSHVYLKLYEQYCVSQFSSVQSLSRVRLFATPWIAARQASLSITNSRIPPKPMSIESVMPSSHLILCLLSFRITSCIFFISTIYLQYTLNICIIWTFYLVYHLLTRLCGL